MNFRFPDKELPVLSPRLFFGLFSAVIVVAISCVLYCSPGSAPGEGVAWLQWRRQQRITAGLSGIDRLYTFQDSSAAAAKFANQAGLVGRLSLELPDPGKSSDAFSVAEGRWPWKQAVRLRHAALHSRLSVPTHEAFSFHTWFRHFGEADAAESFYGTVCSVMSMGDGVNVGWCLQLLGPAIRCCFPWVSRRAPQLSRFPHAFKSRKGYGRPWPVHGMEVNFGCT